MPSTTRPSSSTGMCKVPRPENLCPSTLDLALEVHDVDPLPRVIHVIADVEPLDVIKSICARCGCGLEPRMWRVEWPPRQAGGLFVWAPIRCLLNVIEDTSHHHVAPSVVAPKR